MRNFGIDQQFNSIKKSAEDAARKIFPIEGKLRGIRIEGISVEDKLDVTDYAQQAKAKNQGTTWGVPVYADLVLYDKATGEILDHAKKVRLFNLPKITPRYSYIVGGNEYQVSNQLRLKSGVYTLRKQNGELKTNVNLSQGKNFDLMFNEEKGQFTISKIGGGQANIPLYPILTELGISNTDIERAWGTGLAQANKSQAGTSAVQKAKVSFGLRNGELKDYFEKTKLGGDVTKLTLGESFDKVSGPMLLASSKKLLQVHQGKQQPEDRDSLAFKEFHGIEDFIEERLVKNKDKLAYNIKRSIDNLKRTKISQIVNPGAFSSVVESFFTQDDKSATPEQTNPLEMLAGQHKVTIMGSGGVKSHHAVTPEMREVHHSHYGFIDVVATPECYDEDTEVFTKDGWIKWSIVNENTFFACRVDNKLEFHTASKLHKSHYNGPMYGAKNSFIDYLVTPDHRMYVRPPDRNPEAFRIETALDVSKKTRTFCTTSLPYESSTIKYKYFNHITGSNSSINIERMPINDWCEFMGWFLSEGCSSYNEKTSEYLTRISQSNSVNPDCCEKIASLLNRLPWSWNNDSEQTSYGISNKQLAWHLKDQGLACNKYIPEELFEAPVEARKLLMEALLLGDGRLYSNRKVGASYKQEVFTTTSIKLAEGFEKLAIGLGYCPTVHSYSDKREERYLDVFEVRLLQKTNRSARTYNFHTGKSDYYTQNYEGNVYCATVPGSLLLVKRNGGIPMWLGNSDRIGANMHTPLGVQKDGKDLKMVVKDKAGKPHSVTSTEAYNLKIAFPNQKGNSLKAMYQGKIITISPAQVDYYTPSHHSLFSWSTNMVPFLASDQGNRTMMASKMLEQAISLKHREEPLVQIGTPGLNKTMEEVVGSESAIKSPIDGVVKKITDDMIQINDQKINLYNYYSLNRKSYIHHTPVVKVGDKVKKDQLLADNNFTRNGTLSLGTNLVAAYVPYHGYNFEDGIVITEGAAKKLTSEHIHKKSIDIADNTILKLGTFRTQYPNAYTADQLSRLDDTGVIKKGMKVHKGDVVIAALQKTEASAKVGVFSKALSDRPKDISAVWTYDDEAVVIDVQRHGKTVTVMLRTEEQARIGDKLAGRHGNKGIITKVIPDGEAPQTKDGKPVDILLNPHGVISRINIGQMYESAVGKVAKKTGKKFVVDNFTGEDYLEKVKDHLKDNKIDDKEDLYDPLTGKTIPRVHVGNTYILKLFKQSQGNFSHRQGGPGQPYDINQQPLKAGGEESSKSLDLLTMYSMLSHGSRANLREMSWLKSNQNDEFWKALKSGQQLPPPKSPMVYDKFTAYLRGAGIDVKKDGTKLTLAPLTDKDALDLSNGEVTKPVFYKAKNMEPIVGGFLDPMKFGGFKGTKWGHIELKEPTLNPVFEDATRKLLGLGGKFDEIIEGRMHLKDGQLNKDGKGLTGGEAIEKMLKGIDVDKEIEALQSKVSRTKGAALDDINKKLRYLEALKKLNLKANEAYIRRIIPIVPPVYRPTYSLPDGNITTSDVNHMYQNLGILNQLSKDSVMDMLPEEDKAIIRKDIYEHTKGISGLSDMSIKGRDRSGFISEIKGGTGGQPKEGFFISKVISKRQDFVGRGTIIPEPSLGIDEVAMPEQMAWKLFEPFVIRELGKFGKTPNQALDEIKNKSKLAKQALDIVMKDRHVLLNRAPSLHKFSIMAFKPQITSGTAIKIPPLVVKGFNADFDGDTMTVHVPVTDEANKEAEKMLPSKNLYAPGSGKLMIAPTQEAQIGMYYLSKTPAGRKLLGHIVGDKFPIESILDKGATNKLLARVSKESPNEFARIVQQLKEAGEKHAYERGFTLGIEDLSLDKTTRDKLINTAGSMASKTTNQAELSKINESATALVNKILDSKLKNTNNPLYDMIESGARGSSSQLRSIMATPLFVNDSSGSIVAKPIKRSYSEGLDISDYWTSMSGARKGMIDRAIQTYLPGMISKDLMATAIDNVISAIDCGTQKGIKMPVTSSDAIGRYLAGNQSGTEHNTLIDSQILNKLGKSGLKIIEVRSPLMCLQSKGTCAKCYGLDETGELPEIGENIGAKAGQTIAEPLTQMTMNSFHTGGVAGTGADAGGFARIDQLLKMPKIVVGSASLSPVDGKVSKIEKGLGGGYDVHVGDNKIHVASGLKLKVDVGSHVEAGDPMSNGVIKPQDLVQYKGMQLAQEYIASELGKAYAGQGVRIHGKVYETLVRSLGNTTKILNNSKDSDYVPGDIASYNAVRNHNENLVTTVHTDDSVGMKLNKSYGDLRMGHEMDAKDAKMLRMTGANEVEVRREEIKHAPMLTSITTVPLLKKNWMSALGYRNLAKALTEGAGQAWTTDLEDYHPVPAFAFGSTFGKGKDGRY